MSDDAKLKPATAAVLQQLVDGAKNNPAEQGRLASDPEAVLKAMGYSPVPGALDFLKTLGVAKFTEPPPSSGPRDAQNGNAEAVG